MIKNHKDQLILLSTPNSGSDWFSNILAEKEEKKYFREFFNPITNEKYTDLLANSFGCELVSTYKNIASQNLADCETTYNNTWKSTKRAKNNTFLALIFVSEIYFPFFELHCSVPKSILNLYLSIQCAIIDQVPTQTHWNYVEIVTKVKVTQRQFIYQKELKICSS